MKINKITVVDGIITVQLDQYPSSGVANLYLDSVDNSRNKYEIDKDKHDYVLLDVTVSGNNIIIDSKKLKPEVDLSAFTIYADGVLGFYYDDKELYYKQVDLLTQYCNDCLDKEQKENIVVYAMRYNMLQYAVVNELLEDQINLYKDIARLLGIDTKRNQITGYSKCSQINNKCVYSRCKNGTCKLC